MNALAVNNRPSRSSQKVLKVYETREILGLVFAWFGRGGRLPHVHSVGPVTVDGAYLKSCFDFKRVQRILGVKDLVYESSAVTHVYGLGYSFVEIYEKTIDMHARLWDLPTPIDGTLIDLVLVGQLREIRKPRRFITDLGFVPMKLRQRLMSHILLSQQKRDVLQDVVIYRRNAGGDGNVEGNGTAVILRHIGSYRVPANPILSLKQPEIESVRVVM